MDTLPHPKARVAREWLNLSIMQLRTRLLINALVALGAVSLWTDEEDQYDCGLSFEAVDFQVGQRPLERQTAGYRHYVLSLLSEREYDGLDQSAEHARAEKQRFANGLWKLHQFYSAFPLSESDPDAAWEARLAEIRAWQTSRPQSPAAAIALAEVYTAYAWKARGAENTGEPTSPRALLSRERLEAGLAVLEDARPIAAGDPHYWRAAHGIAAGLGWSAAELNDLYTQATAIDPHYWSNDIAKISALLARHGADPESVESFAASASAAADEYGAEIYARAAWEVSDASGNILCETPFDWTRVQAGYRALLEKHPNSTDLLSQYCVLACRARDKAAARKCFVKLAGRADLAAFKTPRGYERHLRWASWN
jgi:hypothetical protein